MATPRLLTVRDFTTSRYSQLAENTEGQLTDILARAETAVESRLGRKLASASYAQTYRPTSSVMFMRNRPVTAVTAVSRRFSPYSAWITMDPAHLIVNHEAGYVESLVPVVGYDVQIVYTAGYPVLPEDLKEAIIMQAVLFSTQDLEVYGSGDGKRPGYLYMQQDIDRLLEPYMLSKNI